MIPVTTARTGRSTDREVEAPDNPGLPEPSGRVARALWLVLAIVLAGMAIVHPQFRAPEGHLGALAVLPLAVAAACVLHAWAVGTPWARASAWLGLAVTGQAVALQLMNAGNLVGYQHYPAPSELLRGSNLIAVAWLAAQGAVVVLAGRSRIGRALRGMRLVLGRWGLAWVAVAFVLTSATLSQHIAVYLSELVLASAIQVIILMNVVLVATSLPRDATAFTAWRHRLSGADAGREARGLDAFAATAALWVLILGAVLARFVYQSHPHVPDEVVYLYHARYFAQGILSMPLPPVPAAFDLDLMTFEATRWYSPVPPGWPAALSIGVLLGVPWLVNPVLNALNVLLAYGLLSDIYDRRTARVVTVLLAASPWFVFMGMNFMTHTFTLTCALIAAWCALRIRQDRGFLWTVPGGVALGTLGLIRPLEGLVMAVLIGLWAVGWPWSLARVVKVFALAAVSLATVSLTFPYNERLTGDPGTFPLMAYTDAMYGEGTNALGFGANRGLGWPGLDPLPGHGILDVLVNANLNLYGVNVELLGWGIGSILPILLLLGMRRLGRADGWMLIVAASVIGIHSLYWFSGGPDFGARYWYLIILPCTTLAARGILELDDRFRQTHGASPGSPVLAGMLALVAITIVCFFPWRAVDKYYHYRGMRPDVRYLAAQHDFGRSVVLVRGNRHPDYASAATYNPIDPMADAPVYVWDRDPDVTRQVLAAYADRRVWIVDGPTRTGGGFVVAGGPFRSEDLLSGPLPNP